MEFQGVLLVSVYYSFDAIFQASHVEVKNYSVTEFGEL